MHIFKNAKVSALQEVNPLRNEGTLKQRSRPTEGRPCSLAILSEFHSLAIFGESPPIQGTLDQTSPRPREGAQISWRVLLTVRLLYVWFQNCTNSLDKLQQNRRQVGAKRTSVLQGHPHAARALRKQVMLIFVRDGSETFGHHP